MDAMSGPLSPHDAVAEIWRRESPRVIAGLVRMTRDLTLAEDLAQDALLAAVEQWPAAGVPANPGAWLMTVAKRRAVDHFRTSERLRHSQEELGTRLRRDAEEQQVAAFDTAVDFIEDDQLRLMFLTCHPVLSVPSRVALTLRLLGGLTTPEVARALLSDERAVAQRIVRAKRSLATVEVPVDVPTGADRQARLAAVLEVVYLIFTEGYAATAGDDWTRPALCREAIRLSRLLTDLAPHEQEAHGLLALLQLQASRLPARTTGGGEPILLGDQDRTRWDADLVRRGLASLDTARHLAPEPGPYTLQAAISACHARATEFAHTDWPQIAGLYDELAALSSSPVVEVNRAVAHGMAFGPAAGLRILDSVADHPALRAYHLLPSVRADLLRRLGRHEDADRELDRAAALARNDRERAMLDDRRRSTSTTPGRPG
jgi:RNA polymerase sigma factor (sigma-70 family)